MATLIVRFPDQSPSFVHGFEAGQWWQRLKAAKESDVEVIDTRNGFPIHRENEDVISAIANEHGFICILGPVGSEYDDTYTHCRFDRRPIPEPQQEGKG